MIVRNFYRHWNDYYIVRYSDANHFGEFEVVCKKMSDVIRQTNELIRNGIPFQAEIEHVW